MSIFIGIFLKDDFIRVAYFGFDPPIELLYNRIDIILHTAPYKDGTGSVSHQK